jgi:hypothetical protein
MVSGLLGSLLGFGGSVVPAITDHFKTKADNKFKLEQMTHMAELRKMGFDQDVKMYEQQASDNEHQRLIDHDIAIAQSTGFVAGLQKSVRPVITYCFFGLFAAIEVSLLVDALEQGVELSAALNVLWDDDTKAIFAAIISFWFGSRAIDKSRSK